jgi:hypothetical protein
VSADDDIGSEARDRDSEAFSGFQTGIQFVDGFLVGNEDRHQVREASRCVPAQDIFCAIRDQGSRVVRERGFIHEADFAAEEIVERCCEIGGIAIGGRLGAPDGSRYNGGVLSEPF